MPRPSERPASEGEPRTSGADGRRESSGAAEGTATAARAAARPALEARSCPSRTQGPRGVVKHRVIRFVTLLMTSILGYR